MRCSVVVLAVAVAGRWSWQRGRFDGASFLVVLGSLALVAGLLLHEQATARRIGGRR